MYIAHRPSFPRVYSNQPQSSGSGTAEDNKMDKSFATEGSFATAVKKNTSSLPDGVVEKIQEMARKDAGKGVYMDNEFIAYKKQYMKSHISPNRSKLISFLTPMLNNALCTNGAPRFFRLPNLPFTGMLQGGTLTGPSMFIYDNSGTQILSYDTRNGWMSHPSKAESQFQGETKAIYYQAYKAARAEMKANPVQNDNMAANSGLDMRA